MRTPVEFIFNISSDLIIGVFEIIGTVFIYLTFFEILWKEKIRLFQIFNVNGLKSHVFFYLFFIGVGLILVANTFLNMFTFIIDNYITKKQVINSDTENINFDMITTVILNICIAPIFEELFFRKYLVLKLAERYQVIQTLIFSSLCFALIHIDNPANLIPSFIFGIVSGVVFIKSGVIHYSVFLHLIINTYYQIQLFGFSFFSYINPTGNNYHIFNFLLGIILIVAFMRKVKSQKN